MDDEATLVGEPEDDEDDEGDDAIIAVFLDDDALDESQGSHQALLNKLMQTPPKVGALTTVLK